MYEIVWDLNKLCFFVMGEAQNQGDAGESSKRRSDADVKVARCSFAFSPFWGPC